MDCSAFLQTQADMHFNLDRVLDQLQQVAGYV